MCGIAGFSGRFSTDLLSRMNQLIEHRGPDDHGEWFDAANGIGIANRRLSIIDLSPLGHQPMANDDESIRLVYNGEIYNYRELREGLKAKGHRFKSETDTEVLLHMYEDEGEKMLSRLNGIFAFALWDAKKRELFLARDGVGVKPFYYAETSSGFLFASELKSLLQSDEVSRDLDFQAVHQHMAYLWTPAPTTILKGVRKLPPGNALIVRDGRSVRQWAFYDLPYDGRRLEGDEASITRELQEKLEAAVSRQMVSDVPIGAMLSGGLDSSAVVAMMRRAQPDSRPQCYTIGFEDGEGMDGDDQDITYAREVAAHLDVDLHPINIGPGAIDQLEKMLYFLDEPQADPAPINSLLISEHARRDGVKVLLSGTGGDDIFSGYRRHMAVRLEQAWSWLPQIARRGISKVAEGARGSGARTRRFHRAFANAHLSSEQRMIAYFQWNSEQQRQGLYTSDLSASLKGFDVGAPLARSLSRIPESETDPLNRILYLDAKHFLADHNLNYLDKTGMASGVEIRVPLLDQELIEFAAAIPPKLKLHGTTTKYILRKAMEPYLPHNTIYRPKTGFGMPLRRWLHRDLKEMVGDVLSESSLANRGLFQGKAVSALIEQDRQGKVDGAYTIFSLLCIELWCRIFLDRSISPGAPPFSHSR